MPGVYEEVTRAAKVFKQFGPVWEGNPPGTANYIDSGGVQSREGANSDDVEVFLGSDDQR